MRRPIAISLSPNAEIDDIMLALKTIFMPWKWNDNQEVKKFESDFAKVIGNDNVLAVNSGRSAEYLILKAMGIKSGDEVIIQAFSCVAVPNSILWLGATPVYVDIDDSYNMDVDDLKKKITKMTKAVIIQHTFGIPADIEKIRGVVEKEGLYLIEDCAHSLGVKINNKYVGTFGDAAFFSFGRDKIISSVFGGMAITSNNELFEKMRKIRANLNLNGKFWTFQQLFHPIAFSFILPTYNSGIGKLILFLFLKLRLLSKPVYREEMYSKEVDIFPAKMSGALAILARNQLHKLNKFNQHRKHISDLYISELGTTNLKIVRNNNAIWLRFPISHPKAYDLFRYLKSKKILVGKWYKDVLEPGINMSDFHYKKGSCPKAEYYAKHTINLPTYPLLSVRETNLIIYSIKQWLKNLQ